MAGFSTSTTIQRPIADVFAVLTDVENTERWFPAEVHETWMTPPPHGVGSVRHAVVTMMGRRQENDATVTVYDPPRRAALAGDQAGMRWTASLDFSPAAAGTLVHLRFDADPKGAATRLALPPFLWWYRRSWEKGLGTLARMMEAGEL